MGQIASRVLRGGARVVLAGLAAGLVVWAASAGVRELLRRRAGEALDLAAQTPLGRLLPEPEPDSFPEPGPEPGGAGAPGAAGATTPEPADTEPAPPGPADTEPAPPGPASLPIPDFDTTTVASLRARLRRLSLDDLIVLRDWERSHGNRAAVVSMLNNRIAKVQASPGT